MKAPQVCPSCKKLQVKAFAKINLYLHITGRRDDGYHLLDSLFAFADYGDTVLLEPSKEFIFKVRGRFAASLGNSQNNIVIKAVNEIKKYSEIPDTKIVLYKNLPVASGIGGGSADAGAVIRGLCELWQLKLDEKILEAIAISLGADVLPCLKNNASQVSGIGEVVTPYKCMPKLFGVLVNPMVAVATPDVFKNYQPDFSEAMPFFDKKVSTKSFLDDLKKRKNDLQTAAIAICPEIKKVLDSLAKTDGCVLYRMSGSGATCFGLYNSKREALAAKHKLLKEFKGWWVKEVVIKNKIFAKN